MEPFGYVVTYTASDALELFVDPRVRYAAHLDDGSGLVAYDGEPGVLVEFGTVMPATEDFLWPFHAAPKRGIGTGEEVFSLVPALPGIPEYLGDQESVTGLVSLAPSVIFVESRGPVAIGNVWSARVVAFRDKRLEDQGVHMGAGGRAMAV